MSVSGRPSFSPRTASPTPPTSTESPEPPAPPAPPESGLHVGGAASPRALPLIAGGVACLALLGLFFARPQSLSDEDADANRPAAAPLPPPPPSSARSALARPLSAAGATDRGANNRAISDRETGPSRPGSANTPPRNVFPLDCPTSAEQRALDAALAALSSPHASPARRHAAHRTVRRWKVYLATPARPPLAVMRVSSFQGWRQHPITGGSDFHGGVDLAAPRSTPVYAPGAGQVVVTGEGGGYGLYVILEHKPTPYRSLLGHLSRIDVDDGQRVEAGAQIGAVGSTGLSTGPHLHFEVQVGGSPVLLPELYDSLLQQRDSIASASASPLPQ